MYKFELFPFNEVNIDLKLECLIEQEAFNDLKIKYLLSGDVDQINLPNLSNSPQRSNFLWKESCFEFFISHKNKQEYLEFNFAPTGNWNCSLFDDYLLGMRDYRLVENVVINTKKEQKMFELTAQFNIKDFISDDDMFINLSTILKMNSGNKLHYALIHGTNKPDFHNKELWLKIRI